MRHLFDRWDCEDFIRDHIVGTFATLNPPFSQWDDWVAYIIICMLLGSSFCLLISADKWSGETAKQLGLEVFEASRPANYVLKPHSRQLQSKIVLALLLQPTMYQLISDLKDQGPGGDKARQLVQMKKLERKEAVRMIRRLKRAQRNHPNRYAQRLFSSNKVLIERIKDIQAALKGKN